VAVVGVGGAARGLHRRRTARVPPSTNGNFTNKHEKKEPDDDKQVPPDKTPNPNDPKPGKHRK